MTSAEKAARITEIQTEIAEIDTTLSNMRQAGQSYTIMTSAGGGTQRATVMITYIELVKHKKELNAELKTLQGESAFRMRATW